MPYNQQQILAAAPRIHARAEKAFAELAGGMRATPPTDEAQDVAALAAGIFAGSVTNDPEGMVRAVQLLSEVVAYAAVRAAYGRPLVGEEGGHASR